MRKFTRWRGFAIAVALAICLIVAFAALKTQPSQVGTTSAAAAKSTSTSLATTSSLHSQTPPAIAHSSGVLGVRDPIDGARSSPAITTLVAVAAITIAVITLLIIAYVMMKHRATEPTTLKPDRKRRLSVSTVQADQNRPQRWYHALRGLPAGLMSVMAAPAGWFGASRLTT